MRWASPRGAPFAPADGRWLASDGRAALGPEPPQLWQTRKELDAWRRAGGVPPRSAKEARRGGARPATTCDASTTVPVSLGAWRKGNYSVR